MEDWEAPYMKELAGIVCMNGGIILEIGFGLGISARDIQSHPVDKHIIIEANDDVFTRLTEFAQTAEKKVVPIFGLWQEVVPSIADGSIDGIIFDAYPLNADDADCQYPFFEHAFRMLKEGGIFTYYSDEATQFTSEHIQKLRDAGFEKIDKRVVDANPPDDCLYWQDKTFLVPIVRK
jgi:guanidinoacetate N-methyltransferase